MTETEVRNTVKRLVGRSRSMSDAARQLSVSPQYLHDFLKGQRQPGNKILAALGLKKVVIYRRR